MSKIRAAIKRLISRSGTRKRSSQRQLRIPVRVVPWGATSPQTVPVRVNPTLTDRQVIRSRPARALHSLMT